MLERMPRLMRRNADACEGTALVDRRGETKDPVPRIIVIREEALDPLDANVQFMTVMATKMPYIGRG